MLQIYLLPVDYQELATLDMDKDQEEEYHKVKDILL